jgi:hypothetical protein
MLAIDIVERHDLNAANLEGGFDIHHAVPAAANQAKLELATIASDIRCGTPERGQSERGGGSGSNELSSID